MRTFGFGRPDGDENDPSHQWALHIQCSWRFQVQERIITGLADWYEPCLEEMADSESDLELEGVLQNARFSDLFGPAQERQATRNHTPGFIVESAEASPSGDLLIKLSGGYELIAFPHGSRVEYWRLFQRGIAGSHCVCGVAVGVDKST